MRKNLLILILSVAYTVIFAQNVRRINAASITKATELLPEKDYKAAVERHIGTPVLTFSQPTHTQTLVPCTSHPFIFGLHSAYAQHRSFAFSPDMIWLLIRQGVAKHIDANAEEMRTSIVDFQGKKKLKIDMTNKKFDPKNKAFWEIVTQKLVDSIKNNVKKTVNDPLFSTTGNIEKMVFQIATLESMSSYFDYNVNILCGIPEIYLEGTLEDWQKLENETASFLKEYNYEAWHTELKPILRQFVAAAEGKTDTSFWQSMYLAESRCPATNITGWVIKFFPYLSGNRPNELLHDKNYLFSGVPHLYFDVGTSAADINITYNNDTIKRKFELIGGFVGISQNSKTLALRPEIGWCVREKIVESTEEVVYRDEKIGEDELNVPIIEPKKKVEDKSNIEDRYYTSCHSLQVFNLYDYNNIVKPIILPEKYQNYDESIAAITAEIRERLPNDTKIKYADFVVRWNGQISDIDFYAEKKGKIDESEKNKVKAYLENLNAKPAKRRDNVCSVRIILKL